MSDLIVKANKLIEAKYKLNIVEARLILKLVSTIEKEDSDFKIYKFKVNELLNEFKMNKENYRDIKNSTYSLIKRAMKIKEHKSKRELQVGFLSSADYYDDKGILELCFDPKLKPYLLQLKESFTSYRLENVKRFNKVYAIRFYELMKQYQKIGTRRFSVSHLKDILGIGKDEYKQYSDFKKRVVLAAQEELLEKSDLRFEFKEIKKRKKVIELEFLILNNKIDYKSLDRKAELKKQAKKISKKEKQEKLDRPLFT